MNSHRPKHAARLEAVSRKLAAVTAALAKLLAVSDPRNLKPGELIRSLNSTPLGQVLSGKLLRAHRERAGLRISDEAGKRIDLLRYAAWLAFERHRKEISPPGKEVSRGTVTDQAEAYAAKKERERARNAAASESGRDIGELPPVADPQRRARALADPEFFCTAYFPRRFTKAMSDDQRASITALKRVIEQGGTQAFAAPRGDGKTTRAEVLAIWAILTGQRRFVGLVGATKSAADDILQSIRGEFEANELLLADFPEVCFPIVCLEGIYNRCKGQLYKGEQTRMRWSGDMLVLPTIPDSAASGAVIVVRGITGRIRGPKFRRPDGETVRPDLAIVDDPQTERSANSASQCRRRLDTITGAILGWAGPGESIACFVPCTVIVKDDLADQILDREKLPAFQGVRTRLVYDWPADSARWEEYGELRRQSLRRFGDGRLADALYKKHRKAMDRGAKVAWAERYDREGGELSAVQHAMNLKIDRAATFDAEYQNDPRDPATDDEKLLTPSEIAGKTSGLARGAIPLAATKLTAFIDVQQRALYFAVCGWSLDFTGSCIEYGTWPGQGRSFFIYREIAQTIQQRFPTAGVPGAIRGALDQLVADLAAKEYTREDGATMRIEKVLIDSGNWADAIYQCVRESPHSAILVASKGKGVTSDRAPISEWKRHPGQVVGEEWMLGRVENKRATRLLTYDTHFWKTRLFTGLATAVGDRGAFTLFGSRRASEAPDHSMIAAHLASETRKKTQGGGRVVFVYTLRPEKPDNHLLDCLVGNGVAASLLGCRLIGQPLITKPKPARGLPRVSPLSC
jgi:hypothetical protein